MINARLTCWAVSDGRRGMENQALGLAEAMARLVPMDVAVRRIRLHRAVDWLAGTRLAPGLSMVAQTTDEHGNFTALQPPWPDIWVACGRRTLALSRWMKRHGHSFVVQTQDPRLPPRDFDLVIPPAHDGLEGTGVFPILGAPHRVTPERIAEAAQHLRPRLTHLTERRLAVLIGGPSKAYKMTPETVDRLTGTLVHLQQQGWGLMITTSRRTPASLAEKMRTGLDAEALFWWDGRDETPNPYPGMLGLADHILVTEESTNMLTEAAASGRPVHLLPLDGHSGKFARLHVELARRGIARPVALPLTGSPYPPLQETDRAAREVLIRAGHEALIGGTGRGAPS